MTTMIDANAGVRSPADMLETETAADDTHQARSHSAAWTNLAAYTNQEYDPGANAVIRTLWYVLSLLVFESGCVPLSAPKRFLLRLFGARVGRGAVIKPHVRIKYPWRLTLGDHCWIGQGVWIDNLADVRIGSHVCVSQSVYFCTGSHDYSRTTFDLIIKPVVVEDGAWIGASAAVMAGVSVAANAVVAAGSIVIRDVSPAAIVAGNPARETGRRRLPPAVAGSVPV